MSYDGRWDDVYAAAVERQPYGDTRTYDIGATFLQDCASVEDWGCGYGWFRTYLPPECNYVGIDGSSSPFADRVADLLTYRSAVDGIFMRHVLEHNLRWQDILDNALASFGRKLVIILFTPLADRVEELARCGRTGVPDLSLPGADLLHRLDPFHVERVEIESATHYGRETVLLVER